MAANYLSGVQAAVLIGATPYSFSKWSIPIEIDLPKITNFTSQAFQAIVAAVTRGTITLQGPYNQGNMPFTAGSSYTFILQYTNSVSITVTALIEQIRPDIDVEDAQRITIVAKSNGTFTAAIT
jgi:hypothetical protein